MKNGLVTSEYGCKIYYKNDLWHRTDGPAVEWPDTTKYWYQNDLLHRIDGPAIEFSYGIKVWYVNGKRINCTTQKQFDQLMRLKAFW